MVDGLGTLKGGRRERVADLKSVPREVSRSLSAREGIACAACQGTAGVSGCPDIRTSLPRCISLRLVSNRSEFFCFSFSLFSWRSFNMLLESIFDVVPVVPLQRADSEDDI